jgi:RNA polymerase sigma factor (TIGR02999 family)
MSSEIQPPGEITELLQQWAAGDGSVLPSLVESTYNELRAIAVAYVRRESAEQTLQATGLVNELYLRLVHQRNPRLEDRHHFYVVAAMMMRRILRDHARDIGAQKRSGIRIPLHPEMAWVDAASEDVIALDSALAELEQLHERKVRVIELRYFLGCTNDEVAELLGIAEATVDRDLQFARSWLHRRLRSNATDGSAH